MKWKSCYIIFSEVKIGDLLLEFQKCSIEVRELPDNSLFQVGGNTQFKLLNIFTDFSSNDNIKDIYLKLHAITENFLARISLIGYCQAKIIKHLITTVDKCDINQAFDVLSTHIVHKREFKYDISKDDILKIRDLEENEEYIEIALTFLRKALSTNSPEEKIIMLSACLEKLGAEESEEYTQSSCEKCGNIRVTNIKATKKYLKNLLKTKGAKAKDVEGFLDRDRNKIAHGGGKRDSLFYSDLQNSILNVQHIVVELLSERLNSTLVNSQTSLLDLPAVVYRYKKLENNQFDFAGDRNSVLSSMKVALSRVNNSSDSALNNIKLRIGVDFDSSNPIMNKVFQDDFFPK